MKTDDLKSKVLGVMSNEKLTVRQVMERINNNSSKQYAYTTIGTILNRLELDGIVKSKNISNHGRKQKIFSIETDAHKKEVTNFLRSLFIKFGTTGVRHLGEILDTDLNEEDVASIKNKLNL
ncbi:MAG: BlaI/MecI/CopY family transcriptional regulator [Candidatus Heimdallarchaeota archaeon]|nr:BlaI/MecI/CopY family transcriptional regulator [Candidatus Heimdallarchaeota archaeon]